MIRKLCAGIAIVAVLISMAGCKKGAEWYEVNPITVSVTTYSPTPTK